MLFTDQLGEKIHLEKSPERIVSLVPSQSEYLWDLGLRSEITGVTRFCIHPPELRKKATIVGGTKKLQIQRILDLKPDLIIGNKEENEMSQIMELKSKVPVWMSDIVSIESAIDMMRSIGTIVGKEKEAADIILRVNSSLDSVKGIFAGQRVAYFIWSRPYMFAGNHTFIDSVLKHLGFVNAAGSLDRYPVLEIEDLHNAQPDLCFLSSEPYPFNESHVKMIGDLLPESKVILVDGEMFSWYGSRLRLLPEYLSELRQQLV